MCMCERKITFEELQVECGFGRAARGIIKRVGAFI